MVRRAHRRTLAITQISALPPGDLALKDDAQYRSPVVGFAYLKCADRGTERAHRSTAKDDVVAPNRTPNTRVIIRWSAVSASDAVSMRG